MDKTGLIDLRIPETRDYSKFYLKRNPFPAIGVPEETPLITADREMVKKRFKNVVWELLRTGESIITVMVGEYGSGKTHLLKLFKHSVNSQLLPTQKAIAVYVKTPGEDFSDLFFAFIDDIGFDLLNKLSINFISTIMKSEPSLLQFIIGEDNREAFKDSKISYKNLIGNMRFFELAKELKALKFHGVNSDLVLAFLELSNSRFSSVAWRWLLGGSLTKDEKETIHIYSQIDRNDTIKFFDQFIDLLNRINIGNVIILIDELEKIATLMKTRKDRYQDDLRALIDDHPKNICFYFAIAPKQWSDLIKDTTALVRRLKGNWYLLEDFEKDDTRELLENYLYGARIDQYPGKKIQNSFPMCDPSLFPFSNESIVEISKLTKGVVSDILLLARKAIDFLIDQDKYDVITAELINELK